MRSLERRWTVDKGVERRSLGLFDVPKVTANYYYYYFFFFELCTLEPGYLPSRMTSRVPVLRFVTAVGEPCPAHSTVITLLLARLPGYWQPPE